MKQQLYNFGIRKHEGECPDDEFRFDAVISNRDLDAYNSRMSNQSLDNFVEDINAGGIGLLNSHQDKDLRHVLGKWSDAKREKDSVIATATMLRATDKTPDDLNVDEYIRRIERGLYTDVSVGFKGHKEICDICDNPIFDFRSKNRCRHYPGETYDGKLCTYEVRDAHLMEVSLVSDGANSGTQIISIRNAPKELVDWKNGTVHESNSVIEEYGKRYQSDLIDKLIAEKVRAIGHDFDEDKDRKRYLGWSVDDVLEQIDTYKKVTNMTGGRKIEAGSDNSNPAQMPHFYFG